MKPTKANAAKGGNGEGRRARPRVQGENARDGLCADLRACRLKATPPRIAMLDLLRKSARPLSHTEVVSALSEAPWDAATIFRNLVRFEERCLVRVASQVGGVTRYEATGPGGASHLHPHFACEKCDSMSCLVGVELSRVGALGEIARDAGWDEALADADIQFVGICPNCRRPEGNPLTSKRR